MNSLVQWRLLNVQTTRQSIKTRFIPFAKMLPVKLVTFDVTGTLLFFRTPVLEKYVQTGLKFGIRADNQTVGKYFKEAWKTLNTDHPNFGKDTGLGWEKWWGEMVKKTLSAYMTPKDEVKIPHVAEDLLKYHTTQEAFTIRPGTEELLQYLQTKGLKLGVISNYDPRLYKILELVGLSKYLDFTLVSYDFGYSKPDRRIFEEALKLGNCKSGKEAIHIGDDVQLDYLGAKNSGMKAILIKSNGKDLENNEVDKSEYFEDFFSTKLYFQALFNSQLKMSNN